MMPGIRAKRQEKHLFQNSPVVYPNIGSILEVNLKQKPGFKVQMHGLGHLCLIYKFSSDTFFNNCYRRSFVEVFWLMTCRVLVMVLIFMKAELPIVKLDHKIIGG